jgi:hypothetical protein
MCWIATRIVIQAAISIHDMRQFEKITGIRMRRHEAGHTVSGSAASKRDNLCRTPVATSSPSRSRRGGRANSPVEPDRCADQSKMALDEDRMPENESMPGVKKVLAIGHVVITTMRNPP